MLLKDVARVLLLYAILGGSLLLLILSMLSGCCYVVARVFWIIASPKHSGCLDVIIKCCKGVAMVY